MDKERMNVHADYDTDAAILVDVNTQASTSTCVCRRISLSVLVRRLLGLSKLRWTGQNKWPSI